jgi:hypothetical protein
MRRSAVLIVMLAFLSAWVLLAAGTTAVRLTEGVRAFGLLFLPTAAAATMLVLYFHWRERLRCHLVADNQTNHDGVAER